MILDMHVHTNASDDSTATIEGYIDLIREYRAVHPLDGFILTNHRTYSPDLDLKRYWDECGVLVLQGVEMDTTLGHLLVYGVNARVLESFDLSKTNHNGYKVIQKLNKMGAVAVPAHPFRDSLFGSEMEKDFSAVDGIDMIECLNGQNNRIQNRRALSLATDHGLKCIGGSDAHYLNHKWFINCATQFEDTFQSEAELIEALNYGQYRSIELPSAKA